MNAQLKDMRRRFGWTQEELAHQLGVSFVTVNAWENGRRQPSRLARQRIEELDSRFPKKASPPPALHHLVELRSRRDEIYTMARQHGVDEIFVFGSVARGEATPTSDIDFLVVVSPGASLLDLVSFEQALEERFGREFDVVSKRGVNPYLKESIEKEARPL